MCINVVAQLMLIELGWDREFTLISGNILHNCGKRIVKFYFFKISTEYAESDDFDSNKLKFFYILFFLWPNLLSFLAVQWVPPEQGTMRWINYDSKLALLLVLLLSGEYIFLF